MMTVKEMLGILSNYLIPLDLKYTLQGSQEKAAPGD